MGVLAGEFRLQKYVWMNKASFIYQQSYGLENSSSEEQWWVDNKRRFHEP